MINHEKTLSGSTIRRLITLALGQREYAYAPYSHFTVGAALLAGNGEIYTGCNIENGAYSPGNCAERTAVFKAVSEGVREFDAVCIAGGKEGEPPEAICPPCGVCRQVLSEFCGEELQIILAVSEEHYEIHTLGELLPMGFRL